MRVQVGERPGPGRQFPDGNAQREMLEQVSPVADFRGMVIQGSGLRVGVQDGYPGVPAGGSRLDTKRFFPDAFAWYIAVSALLSSVSISLPSSG